MNQAKILVVEDEAIIAHDLRETLEHLGHEVIACVGSVVEALQWLQNERPDLVLIDVMLQGERDGIDLAARLRAEYNLPFVFVTSLADRNTTARAAQTRPSGYIVKPFDERNVSEAVTAALADPAAPGRPADSVPAGPALAAADGLFVRDRKRLVKVSFRGLLWLEAEGNYTSLHAPGAKHTVYNTLKQVEERLPGADFVRVHKSYIVALGRIVSFDAQTVTMADGTSIPVGRAYRGGLLNRLNLLDSA